MNVQSPHHHLENCFLQFYFSTKMKNKGKFQILLSDKLALPTVLFEPDTTTASKALCLYTSLNQQPNCRAVQLTPVGQCLCEVIYISSFNSGPGSHGCAIAIYFTLKLPLNLCAVVSLLVRWEQGWRSVNVTKAREESAVCNFNKWQCESFLCSTAFSFRRYKPHKLSSFLLTTPSLQWS